MFFESNNAGDFSTSETNHSSFAIFLDAFLSNYFRTLQYMKSCLCHENSNFLYIQGEKKNKNTEHAMNYILILEYNMKKTKNDQISKKNK